MIVVSVIQLDKLSKSYHHDRQTIQAVDALSFEVGAGQIFGFLGANGAGKTTTIRMLLRLIHPSAGEAYLFGTPLEDAQSILRTRVGALAGNATAYPFMTGYDYLRTIAYTGGITDHKRIDAVLETTGMTALAGRKTRTYSTGMLQRISIATALLNDPDLLILDEPTNGLDPQGIQDVRALLKHLAQNEGKTIFLSSHLLHEVEQICDHVAIIRNGQLVAHGDVSDLLSRQSTIQIIVDPIMPAYQLISHRYAVTIQDKMLNIIAGHDDIPHLISMLVEHDIAIYSVTRQQKSLEDIFFEVTHD